MSAVSYLFFSKLLRRKHLYTFFRSFDFYPKKRTDFCSLYLLSRSCTIFSLIFLFLYRQFFYFIHKDIERDELASRWLPTFYLRFSLLEINCVSLYKYYSPGPGVWGWPDAILFDCDLKLDDGCPFWYCTRKFWSLNIFSKLFPFSTTYSPGPGVSDVFHKFRGHLSKKVTAELFACSF